MKWPTALVALSVVIVAIGCALHHPVNVEPDYPPEPPFGCALDGGAACVRSRLEAGVRGFDNDAGRR